MVRLLRMRRLARHMHAKTFVRYTGGTDILYRGSYHKTVSWKLLFWVFYVLHKLCQCVLATTISVGTDGKGEGFNPNYTTTSLVSTLTVVVVGLIHIQILISI